MASGRFLSTSIAEDERLGKLSITAELIYIKTIPHLDRDGMISGKPGLLWAKVCPLREELFGNTQAIIDEWVTLGLVIRFATSEGPVLFFPGFAKNNNLPHYERERPSRFPVPPGYTRTDKGLQLLESVQELVQEFALQEQEEDQDQEKAAEVRVSAAAATCDVDVAKVWEAWNANMPGVKTPVIVDAVNELLKEHSAAEIVEAIAIAVKRNKRNLGYVQGILNKGVHSEKPPPSGGDYPRLSEAQRGALLTRAKNAQTSLRTYEKFGGTLDPQWRVDIEKAQKAGVL